MLESVNDNDLPFDECIEILKQSQSARGNHEPGLLKPMVTDIKIDPSFKEFYEWCKSHQVPLVIVSR